MSKGTSKFLFCNVKRFHSHLLQVINYMILNLKKQFVLLNPTKRTKMIYIIYRKPSRYIKKILNDFHFIIIECLEMIIDN